MAPSDYLAMGRNSSKTICWQICHVEQLREKIFQHKAPEKLSRVRSHVAVGFLSSFPPRPPDHSYLSTCFSNYPRSPLPRSCPVVCIVRLFFLRVFCSLSVSFSLSWFLDVLLLALLLAPSLVLFQSLALPFSLSSSFALFLFLFMSVLLSFSSFLPLLPDFTTK